MEHTKKEFDRERELLYLVRIVLTTRGLGKTITCGATGG